MTNRVARYIGNGEVAIVEEPAPSCPPGGLLVKTEACGLCSGELMAWYMDRKIPHVLGHEVSGKVVESQNPRYAVGCRVFPHHHAPCMECAMCLAGKYVHCATWKSTKLVPGGMADYFAVNRENLTDTHRVDDLLPQDAALIEPLACVCKSIWFGDRSSSLEKAAVIGLGNMGLLHMLMLPKSAIGYDFNPSRREWAESQGLQARDPEYTERAETVFVCPGSQAAFDFAMKIIEPGGTIVMFAPLGPGESLQIDQSAYFKDLTIAHSYSCGPDDSQSAIDAIREGRVRADQICSNFISLDQLPEFYRLMKSGAVLKPMVLW